jgi:hypothetical protein
MAGIFNCLTPHEFYLWGNMSKAYRTNHRIKEELKENIQREIWKFLRKNFLG